MRGLMSPQKGNAMAAKKMITREMTLDGMVNDAFSEFATLRDELGEWADNMSSANMEHLPKYEQVDEARNTLDGFCDDEPDMPENVPATLVTLLKWEESGRKKSTSRASRCSEATELLGRVIEHLEAFIEEHDEEDAVWADTDRDEWEQYVTDLTNAKDEAEGVEFPGMFG
jgi:hypothetical protein